MFKNQRCLSKMKKIVSLFSVLFFLAAILISGCKKEEVVQAQLENNNNELGKYTKEVTIYDKDKENSAVLLVGSNDKSILDMWSSENFTLIPVKEGQSLTDILKLDDSNNDETPLSSDEEASSTDNEVAAEISYMIISKNLQVDVKYVALQEKPPYSDDMRGWHYSTNYSESEEGNSVTVNIYGHNFWHRGYYGVFYKVNSNSSWTTVASEWTRIKIGESKSYNRNPCYQMKARRKYKGSTNSVTIEFEY